MSHIHIRTVQLIVSNQVSSVPTNSLSPQPSPNDQVTQNQDNVVSNRFALCDLEFLDHLKKTLPQDLLVLETQLPECDVGVGTHHCGKVKPSQLLLLLTGQR